VIVKIQKAAGRSAFARLGRYLTERSTDAKRAQVLDTNVAGQNVREMTGDLRALSTTNAWCDRPALHVIMRLADDEGRSPREWREIMTAYREGMGMDQTPYLAVSHGPGHVHLIISRVQFDGRVLRLDYSHMRSREVTDRLEERFRLERVRDHPRGWKSLTRAEYERSARRETPPERTSVASRVAEAIRTGDGSMEAFVRELDRRGITARVNQSPTTARIHGVSFEDREARPGERCRYKGSELGQPWRTLGRAIEERTPPDRPRAPRERERERVRERG